MCLGMKAPATYAHFLTFNAASECCQSVIRKLGYGFMRRLDTYVNYIINDTSMIGEQWCSILHINS